MAISLGKGGNVSLSREDPNLNKVLVGLGWDVRTTSGADYDLDASVFVVNEQEKVRSDSDLIFYNNLRSVDGSVEHLGDNLTGEGDDEQVKVDLNKVSADVHKLVFSVTIHDAEARGQSFGQVSGAFIRVANGETNREIVRFDLSEYASTETAMLFGEVYRRGGEWKFRAVGQGFAGGLGPMARSYGVDAEGEDAETTAPPPSAAPTISASASTIARPVVANNSGANAGRGGIVPIASGRATMANGAWINVHAYETPVPPAAYDTVESIYDLFAIDVEGYSGPDPTNYMDRFRDNDFNLQMPDNSRLRPHYCGKEPALHESDLAPDDNARDWITFKKPKGIKPKFIVYSNYREVHK